MSLCGISEARTLSDVQFSFVQSMVLSAAVKLNIANIIAAAGEDATLSAEDIAAKLPTTRPSVTNLKRVLRLLVLHSIFRAEQHGEEVRYGLTPLSQLLVSEQVGSFAPVVRMQLHKNCLTPWLYLDQAVLNEGVEPFDVANGGNDLWAVSKKDPQFGKVVNEAMASASHFVLNVVLPEYQGFKEVQVVADVGGGIGKALEKIIQHNPHIKGINFDLPNVVATAPEIPGVTHVGGDMFKSVPQADAIFMKWILHDWSDEQCIQILKNCHKSLPEKGGKVVLVEMVVPPPDHKDLDELRAAAVNDLLMLAHVSGKERTAAEWGAIFSAAGFSKELTFLLQPGGHSIIEARK